MPAEITKQHRALASIDTFSYGILLISIVHQRVLDIKRVKSNDMQSFVYNIVKKKKLIITTSSLEVQKISAFICDCTKDAPTLRPNLQLLSKLSFTSNPHQCFSAPNLFEDFIEKALVTKIKELMIKNDKTTRHTEDVKKALDLANGENRRLIINIEEAKHRAQKHKQKID